MGVLIAMICSDGDIIWCTGDVATMVGNYCNMGYLHIGNSLDLRISYSTMQQYFYFFHFLFIN